MIEAKLGLLQVQIERLARHAIELRQSPLGEAPEAFDAIDMHRATCELIGPVADPKVLVKAHVHQPVVASPAISVNDAGNVGLAPDDGLQGAFGGIGHDLGVDTVASLEQTKDHRLAARAAAAQAAYAPGTEVGLIGFELSDKGRARFTVLGHASTHAQIDAVDRTQRQPAQLGAVGGRQIHGEVAHELAKLRFTDLGTPEVPVFLNHDRKLAHLVERFAS